MWVASSMPWCAKGTENSEPTAQLLDFEASDPPAARSFSGLFLEATLFFGRNTRLGLEPAPKNGNLSSLDDH